MIAVAEPEARIRRIRLRRGTGARPGRGEWTLIWTGKAWLPFVGCPACGREHTLLLYYIGDDGRVDPKWKCGRNFGNHVCEESGTLTLSGWARILAKGRGDVERT